MTPALPEPRLSALRVGDPDAIERLYRAQAPRLLALAQRLLGAPMDAEDVVHDVFVALPGLLGRYDERGQLHEWLRRVVANRCVSRLRSARELELLDEMAGPEIDDDPFASDRDTLRQAVDRLPGSLRVVVVLHGIEGWPHADVARELRISSGAAQVRFSRAVTVLRRTLNGVTRDA